jgi:hypothetical protein
MQDQVTLFCSVTQFWYGTNSLIFSASSWRLYGTDTLGLQRMVVRILSLTSSSSVCERNWSIFEMVRQFTLNLYFKSELIMHSIDYALDFFLGWFVDTY